jgi:hypothetical protein
LSRAQSSALAETWEFAFILERKMVASRPSSR